MKDSAHLIRGRGRCIYWWPGAMLLVILLLSGCGATSGTSAGATSAPTAPTATTAPSATTAPTATTASTATAQVKITTQSGQYGFDPAMLTVATGTKVVWTNDSSAPHTVTSDTGSTLASDTISTSGTFSFTFTQPGTYTYHCMIHPYMKGTIVVTG